MKNEFRLLALLLCLPFSGWSADETNGYAAIWRRNVFALKTPPPSIIPASPSGIPRQVTLTGIAALPPHKWAALRIQERGKPAESIVLQEGAQSGTLQILEIEAPARRVKINNAGITMTLTFDPGDLRSDSAGRTLPDLAHVPLPEFPSATAGDP